METWRYKHLVWGGGGAEALAVSHIHRGGVGCGWLGRGELTCDVLVLMLLDLWLSYPYWSQLALVNMDVMENLPPVPGRSQEILTHASLHTISRVAIRSAGSSGPMLEVCQKTGLRPGPFIGQRGCFIHSSHYSLWTWTWSVLCACCIHS